MKEYIEKLAQTEYREGVSAAAAARQMCRTLGCDNAATTLKRLLEDLLANINSASFDRSQILSDFRTVNPDEAHAAEMKSFLRNNGKS